MTYFRSGENPDPDPDVEVPQPDHITVTNKLSCIEYDIWNGDYVRARTEHDEDFPPLKQPDILNGWNGDYIQTQADGTKKTGVARLQVEQNYNDESEDFYIKTDIDNEPAPILCYLRRDVDNEVVKLTEEPDGSLSIDGEPVILAVQDDRDNIFVTEDHLYRIELEANTRVTGLTPDATDPSIQTILQEQGKKLVFENGILIRVEEL